jgi:hypothetical protein
MAGWLPVPPSQAIGRSKTNLTARLKYSEISVTRHMAERNAALALQSSAESSQRRCSRLDLHDHEIPQL